MQFKSLSLMLTGLFLLSGTAFADAEAGKAKASMCAGCHGAQGVSGSDVIPNLAGQKKGYLVVAIKAYKEKTRTNGMMNGMVAGLSDQDIENLADHFSGLTPGH